MPNAHAVTLIAALVAALFGTIACAEPGGEVLEGRWGGQQIELVADGSGAEIRVSCGVIRFREAVTLDAGGEVEGRAVIASVGMVRPVHYHMSRNGLRLVIRLTPLGSSAAGDLGTYELRRGTTADFTGVYCLG
jgi:hypothetical protein